MAHKVLDFTHSVIAGCVREGDLVVDATVGNGHDTAFLARRVGERGHVWGFDVQEEAIRSTSQRLCRLGLGDRVTLVRDTHASVAGYVPRPVQAVVFNLGYLPGGARSVTTTAGETVAALRASASLLAPGGRLAVVMYRGHEGGPLEAEAVLSWAESLGVSWTVVRYGFGARRGSPPEVLIAARAHAPR